jgi:hypothetical protein
MRHWLGVVGEERFATERLYARDVITLPRGPGSPEPGDPVVLVVPGSPPRLVGRGVVIGTEGADLVTVRYQHRLFDEPPPVPADIVPAGPGLRPLPAGLHTRLSALASASAEASAGRSVWFVSVALPIEAVTRAEAVREFWTYIDKLGPRELPAYVWPLGDELAMQAFVLGTVANLDPEEDGED